MLRDPFVLTPGFDGPKQPLGNRPMFDEELQTWTAPFVMANINTRNVHRSNMLLGFPYSRDFVYDEMVMTGPGERGEETAKTSDGRQQQVFRRRRARSRARGHRRKSARAATTICCSSRIAPDGRQVACRRHGRSRSRLWLDVEDDLGMRDLPAARRADVAGRHLDAGRGDAATS